MPFGSEGVQAGIGLALSGGGFRATLFHVGSCWRVLIPLGATQIAKYQLADTMPCADQNVQPLAKIRTRLNLFNDQEQEQLINWGYALCDAATRKHVPQIIKTQSTPAWPCPAHSLG